MSTPRIENVYSIASNISSCATHQRSSSAPQSAPPSAQNTPPDSHITKSPSINNSKQNHTPVSPPANMANPCSGSDVAAISSLATLSAAVVQRPLLASKMSTALLKTPPPAQRISARLQRLKPRLPPPNTRTPRLQHHTISQYQQLKQKITNLCLRLRIWPILAQAVTSLQANLLPR